MVKLETTGPYRLKPLTGQPRHFHQQKKKEENEGFSLCEILLHIHIMLHERNNVPFFDAVSIRVLSCYAG